MRSSCEITSLFLSFLFSRSRIERFPFTSQVQLRPTESACSDARCQRGFCRATRKSVQGSGCVLSEECDDEKNESERQRCSRRGIAHRCDAYTACEISRTCHSASHACMLSQKRLTLERTAVSRPQRYTPACACLHRKAGT